jgi:D-arabinose 5-phosphate isomerase GutQ
VDPNCTADHGLTGQVTPDDVVVRVSSEAEGDAAVRAAVDFARALSRATSAPK